MKMQTVEVVKGDVIYGGWPWQEEEKRFAKGQTFQIPVGEVVHGDEKINPLKKLGNFVKVVDDSPKVKVETPKAKKAEPVAEVEVSVSVDDEPLAPLAEPVETPEPEKPDEPEEEHDPDDVYHCTECGRNHRYGSGKGKDHLKYKEGG